MNLKIKTKLQMGKIDLLPFICKLQIHPTYIQELLKDDRYNHQKF